MKHAVYYRHIILGRMINFMLQLVSIRYICILTNHEIGINASQLPVLCDGYLRCCDRPYITH